MEYFGKSTLCNGVHEEGIFISDHCSYPAPLDNFYLFNDFNDIDKVKYPWLRIYNRELPAEGDYKFIPPDNWRESLEPIRDPQSHGFIDFNGNVWKWDRLHNNHWDVQHTGIGAGYSNVTIDGRVL